MFSAPKKNLIGFITPCSTARYRMQIASACIAFLTVAIGRIRPPKDTRCSGKTTKNSQRAKNVITTSATAFGRRA